MLYTLLKDIVQLIFFFVLISYCGIFFILSFSEVWVSLHPYKLRLISNTGYANLFSDMIANLKL